MSLGMCVALKSCTSHYRLEFYVLLPRSLITESLKLGFFSINGIGLLGFPGLRQLDLGQLILGASVGFIVSLSAM